MVRASGAGLCDAASRLLGADFARRAAAPGRVPVRGGLSVPALILTFPGPRSSTGEDTVELLLPGNPHVLERVTDELMHGLRRLGHPARRAGPGEFTARAYLNGRLDLVQAEGVAMAISAGSDAELRAARLLLAGSFGAVVDAWAGRVAEVLARVEAGIDFVDQEDVVAISCGEILLQCQALRADVAGHLAGDLGREARSRQPRVVLAGAPNAGKSTLFNALLGRERTIASPVSGTTRDAIVEPLALQTPGGRREIHLVDLPGLDTDAGDGLGPDAPSVVDAAMRRVALAALESCDLVLRCRSIETPGWDSAGAAFTTGRAPLLEVVTKIDRVDGARVETDGIATSAVTGEGIDLLRRCIAERLEVAPAPMAAEMSALSDRAKAAIRAAATALDEVIQTASDEPAHAAPAAPEVVAAGLRTALDRLGEIRGRVDPDEVLGMVFSRFCIGK